MLKVKQLPLKRKRSRDKCAVMGCKDYFSTRHRFPKRDDEVFNKWVEALSANPRVTSLTKNDILRKLFVCDRHFATDTKCPELVRGLKYNAVPTLFITAPSGTQTVNPSHEKVPDHMVSSEEISTLEWDQNCTVIPLNHIGIGSTALSNQKGELKEDSVKDVQFPVSCYKLQLSCPASKDKPIEECPEVTCTALGDECRIVKEELDTGPEIAYEEVEENNLDECRIVKVELDTGSEVAYEEGEENNLEETSTQIQESTDNFKNVPSEGVEESIILENIKKELCRVCGNKEKSLIPIFGDISINDNFDVPLLKMLEMYLPIEIVTDDLFPLSICSNCYNTLYMWHELYVTCVAANKVFKSTFCKDKNKDESESAPYINGVQEDAALLTDSDDIAKSDHNYVKTQEDYFEKQDGGVKNQDDNDKNPGFEESKPNVLCERCGSNVNKEEDEISSEILDLLCSRKIRLYICKYCAEPFKNVYELRDHYKSCEEDSTICELCGKIISHRKNFEKHYKQVHDPSRVMCEKCGKSMRPHLFNHHINSVHSQTYYCELCCKILRSKLVYNSHMQNHLKGKIKSTFKIEPVSQDGCYLYICPVCNVTFYDKQSIIIHLTEIKSVQCTTCRVKLKNEKEFVLHTCKEWNCQYCDKTFYSKVFWKDHERIHTGEKPYKCRFCNTYFRKLQQRTMHHRTHLIRSCECKFCFKKFKHASALRKHMTCHEGVEFSCPICCKKFPRQLSVQVHLRRHMQTIVPL